MTENPFATVGEDDSDDFETAPQKVSQYPSVKQLKGRLVLIKVTKYQEGVPSKFRNSDGTPQLQNRITADLYLVDGTNLEGITERSWTDMYLSQSRIVAQLKRFVGGRMVLGRIDTRDEHERAGVGNPWGLQEPSPEDVEKARAFWKERQAKANGNPFA